MAQCSSSSVAGNASDAVKNHCLTLLSLIVAHSPFANDVARKLKITEISIKKEPGRKEQSTVVCEIQTGENMVNGFGTMHGACIACLIDCCSSIPLVVLSDADDLGQGGVSQTLNIVYHSPAKPGSNLRIISSIISRGRRTATMHCEILDIDRNIVVASGTHVKMAPSSPNSKL